MSQAIDNGYYERMAEQSALRLSADVNAICNDIRTMHSIDVEAARTILAVLSARLAKEPGYGSNHDAVEVLVTAHDDL